MGNLMNVERILTKFKGVMVLKTKISSLYLMVTHVEEKIMLYVPYDPMLELLLFNEIAQIFG